MSSTHGSRLVVLEGLRGFAASYVVVHHISPLRDTSFEWLTRFGQEAVTVFFLLSGFVIHYSRAREPELSARSYFIKRFRRIYPSLFVALVITALVQLWLVGPGAELKPGELALNLLMLQDIEALRPGALAAPYLSNSPLWSLSYEWWFYVLYYLIVSRVPRDKWLLCVAAIVAAGIAAFVWMPSFFARVAMLFGVWWLGVEMARAYLAHGRVRFDAMAACLALVAGLAAALVLNALWISRTLDTSIGRYPWVEPRIVCVGLAMTVLGLIHHRFAFRGARAFLNAFAHVAPISYCLYIFHMPLLSLRSLDVALQGALGTLLITAVIVALSYLVEVRLQPFVSRWLR